MIQPFQITLQRFPDLLRGRSPACSVSSPRSAGSTTNGTHPRAHPIRRAATLVELMCSITIISIVAALVLPVITGAAENYAAMNAARGATERVSFAMERCVRLLRDVPRESTGNNLAISSANSTSIVFSDGRGVEKIGDVLFWRDSTGSSVICESVESFTIDYLAQDGVTSVLGSPATARRFNITLRAAGAEIRCSATARVGLLGT